MTVAELRADVALMPAGKRRTLLSDNIEHHPMNVFVTASETACAERYFADTLWPNFGVRAMGQALIWFAQHKCRFGQIGQQAHIAVC